MQAIFSDPSFLDRKEGRRKGEGRDEERERGREQESKRAGTVDFDFPESLKQGNSTTSCKSAFWKRIRPEFSKAFIVYHRSSYFLCI